jgi:hypothetical protein
MAKKSISIPRSNGVLKPSVKVTPRRTASVQGSVGKTNGMSDMRGRMAKSMTGAPKC